MRAAVVNTLPIGNTGKQKAERKIKNTAIAYSLEILKGVGS